MKHGADDKMGEGLQHEQFTVNNSKGAPPACALLTALNTAKVSLVLTLKRARSLGATLSWVQETEQHKHMEHTQGSLLNRWIHSAI